MCNGDIFFPPFWENTTLLYSHFFFTDPDIISFQNAKCALKSLGYIKITYTHNVCLVDFMFMLWILLLEVEHESFAGNKRSNDQF